jgi:tRNA(Ile)-lysidine synthase TilS/MesJ
MTKSEIMAYAKEHNLQWHEDSTNASDAYLRNRMRRKISDLTPDDAWQVRALRARQTEIKKQIDSEAQALVGNGPTYSRYFFTHAEHPTALECLRYVTGGRLTRPQCERALLMIKTMKAGSRYEAGAGTCFVFTPRHFSLELVK